MNRTKPEVKKASPPTSEFVAYTIYGEPYRVIECLRCGDQWTSETPNEGCLTCC
jgi:hypothetical protein